MTARRSILPLALALFTLAACQPKERTVAVRGMLSGLPGADKDLSRSSQSPGASESLRDIAPTAPPPTDNAGQPLDKPRNPLRVENEDGTIELLSFAPRHIVANLRETLLNEEYDLIYEQIISDRTKNEYIERGLDPLEARDFFQKRRRDILQFLARMPMGELTPGLFMRHIGGQVYRLELPNRANTRFIRLDFTWEHGVCKLVVIQ
ncbi:MAG: hypothetical protein VYC34_09495 [Planctomycetota bacterium]|nr:hypothetical protein [Planctomycetota bacterium]